MALMSMTKPRQMTDRIVALNLAGMAMATSQALNAAELVANNADLKRLYRDLGQQASSGAEALQTYILDREWAKPFASPEEQLKLALEDADTLIATKA